MSTGVKLMKPRLFAGSVGAAALVAALVGLPATSADALPLPVTTAEGVAGAGPLVDVHYTGWRHRHYRHRHYRHVHYYRPVRYYRSYYRPDPGLAVAGTALGLLGAVAARPYYHRPYYPASYGYYRYSYGYPSYGYRAVYWGGGPSVYGRWYGW